jgi:hypothetical protein
MFAIEERALTHTLSRKADPRLTLRFGPEGSPNACNECHAGRTAAWAAERAQAWWPLEGRVQRDPDPSQAKTKSPGAPDASG